ncbi:hypothetical protein [Vibrio phage XZ1]|uniref:Uncharacterized protein n=1 Tax=Vibrio phage ValKK3 TaxID=1610855 RepID=A0A0D4DBH1_9CAUD|nr:hypothetical protein AVU32_gp325 [Vibrio phage ValKK3]AJT61166.1 hypothetical protein [Vibrio phage ValKK3]QNJ54779.1 hypothetical protein vBValMR10Z_239 [Vibrio phage vB_ValM_R10Z]UOL51212.1 hypothetical protein [Vibrio phage XZ1]
MSHKLLVITSMHGCYVDYDFRTEMFDRYMCDVVIPNDSVVLYSGTVSIDEIQAVANECYADIKIEEVSDDVFDSYL